MKPKDHLTTGEFARRCGVPAWVVRRVADELAADGVAIPRAGLYRLIPLALTPRIIAELERRGWLERAVADA